MINDTDLTDFLEIRMTNFLEIRMCIDVYTKIKYQVCVHHPVIYKLDHLHNGVRKVNIINNTRASDGSTSFFIAEGSLLLSRPA